MTTGDYIGKGMETETLLQSPGLCNQPLACMCTYTGQSSRDLATGSPFNAKCTRHLLLCSHERSRLGPQLTPDLDPIAADCQVLDAFVWLQLRANATAGLCVEEQ